MKNYVQIQWTAASKEEAEKVAHILIEKQLVACANIFPEIHSLFLWEGKISKEMESKVLFKTRPEHFEAIEAIILKEGSYDVPEISMIQIDRGHAAYAEWLTTSVAAP